ncbi:hypothetical protein GCM10023405_16320 [Streptomonospora salina]
MLGGAATVPPVLSTAPTASVEGGAHPGSGRWFMAIADFRFPFRTRTGRKVRVGGRSVGAHPHRSACRASARTDTLRFMSLRRTAPVARAPQEKSRETPAPRIPGFPRSHLRLTAGIR